MAGVEVCRGDMMAAADEISCGRASVTTGWRPCTDRRGVEESGQFGKVMSIGTTTGSISCRQNYPPYYQLANCQPV